MVHAQAMNGGSPGRSLSATMHGPIVLCLQPEEAHFQYATLLAMIRYVYKALDKWSLEQPYYSVHGNISYNIFKMAHREA